MTRMNVLVIEPGHGSFWLEGAAFVDRLGKATTWEHEGGWNIPEGGFDVPYTLTYPRKWILKVESFPEPDGEAGS